MQEAQTGIPETFDYSDSDTEQGRGQYPQLPPDTMFKFVVTEADRSVSPKTGNMQIVVRQNPVGSDEKPHGPTQTRWIDIPVPNPAKAGHVLTTTGWVDSKMVELTGDKAKTELFKKAKEFVRAIEPGAVPTFPYTKEEGGKVWRDAEGNEATQDQMTEATQAQRKAVLAKLKEWYGNPAALINAICYGKTGKVSASNGRTYIKYLTSDPGDETVETENFVMEQ